MPVKRIVKLTKQQITTIDDILNRRRHVAQLVERAGALLLARQNLSDDEIAEGTLLSCKGVQSIRKRFLASGFKGHAPRPAEARQAACAWRKGRGRAGRPCLYENYRMNFILRKGRPRGKL